MSGATIKTLKIGFIVILIMIMSSFAYADTQSISNVNRIFCLVNNRYHQYKIIAFMVHHSGFLQTSLSTGWIKGSPQVISVGKDGMRIYVANAISKTITLFLVMGHTLKECHSIHLNFSPWCIAPYKNTLFVSSLMGSRIYWLNFSHHKVRIIKNFNMPESAIDNIKIARLDNYYGLLVNSAINKKLMYIKIGKSKKTFAPKNKNHWHISEINPRYIRIKNIGKQSEIREAGSRTIYLKKAKSVVVRDNGKYVYVINQLNSLHVYRWFSAINYKQMQSLHYKKMGSDIILSLNRYLFSGSNGFNCIYSYKIERGGVLKFIAIKKLNNNLYITGFALK